VTQICCNKVKKETCFFKDLHRSSNREIDREREREREREKERDKVQETQRKIKIHKLR